MSIDSFKTEGESNVELTFSEAVISHNIVFDLGESLNPMDAARQLLQEEFAVSASNFLTRETELAERFTSLIKGRRQAELYKRGTEELRTHSILRWAVRNPSFASRVITRWARKGFRSDIEEKPDSLSENEEKNPLDKLIGEIDEELIYAQKLSSVHLFADENTFAPFYLSQQPFVRVDLQPLIVYFEGRRRVLDAELLLHRSGVAIFTIHMTLNENKSVKELINLQSVLKTKLTGFDLPYCVVDTWAQAESLTEEEMVEAASSWYQSNRIIWWEFLERDANLANLFEIYRLAISASVLGKVPTSPEHPYSWIRTSDWFSYPITVIKKTSPTCMYSEDMKVQYKRELAGLIYRTTNYESLNEATVEKGIQEDQSLTFDESFFLGASHSVIIWHDSLRCKLVEQYGAEEDIPGQEWIIKQFFRSAPVESLLIQKWILHIMNTELQKSPNRLNELAKLKQALVLGLEELHGLNLVSVADEDLLEFGRKQMRFEKLHQSVQEKLDGLEKLIEVAEGRWKAKRDSAFQLLSLFTTLLLGLPTADRIVTSLKTLNTLPDGPFGISGFYNSLVGWASNDPTTLILSIYVFQFLTVLMVVLYWGFSRREKVAIRFNQSRHTSRTAPISPVKLTAGPWLSKQDLEEEQS